MTEYVSRYCCLHLRYWLRRQDAVTSRDKAEVPEFDTPLKRDCYTSEKAFRI